MTTVQAAPGLPLVWRVDKNRTSIKQDLLNYYNGYKLFVFFEFTEPASMGKAVRMPCNFSEGSPTP